MKKLILILSVFLLYHAHKVHCQTFVKVSNSPVSIDSGASRSVNWIDYDNDHDLDLFISNGFEFGDNNFLYRNDNGTFVRIFNQPLVLDSLPSDGSSWGDFNNDGFTDLCVVNWWNKINLLYVNQGSGNFNFLSSSIICNEPSYSETCSWGDYNNDGLLDLFVTNSFGTNHRNFLYRNAGNNNFVKVDTGIVVNELGRARGMNWVDIDGDRDLDIFVCREANQNEYLYKNNGNGYFTKITNTPLTSNGGESWSGSWGDYDNDNDLDVFVTNFNQRNFLFRNEGNFSFTKITNDTIVNDPGYNAVSGWGDYDNDGDLDMFVTQAYGPASQKLVNRLYKNLLIETGNPAFERIGSGILVNDSGFSYGFAWGDYDNDGDLDIATANTFGENQKNALYKNELQNGNKWINIKCVGDITNRSAIGARVKVKALINGNAVWQLQEVDGQSGYCGQNLILHFGLGNANVIDSMKIEWPSGIDQYFTNVPVNRSVTITENGNIISVGKNSIELSADFALYQNYPNPFNPVTYIKFNIAIKHLVSLIVYDSQGKEIATIVNEQFSAGVHSIKFDASAYPSGVYFYKLLTDKFSETRKMLLIK